MLANASVAPAAPRRTGGSRAAYTAGYAAFEQYGGLRADRLALPDYYLVLESGELPQTWRHWWLGVLAGAAPVRVVPVSGSPAAVAQELGRLAAGRWWPADLETWLRGLPEVVPDQLLTGSTPS